MVWFVKSVLLGLLVIAAMNDARPEKKQKRNRNLSSASATMSTISPSSAFLDLSSMVVTSPNFSRWMVKKNTRSTAVTVFQTNPKEQRKQKFVKNFVNTGSTVQVTPSTVFSSSELPISVEFTSMPSTFDKEFQRKDFTLHRFVRTKSIPAVRSTPTSSRFAGISIQRTINDTRDDVTLTTTMIPAALNTRTSPSIKADVVTPIQRTTLASFSGRKSTITISSTTAASISEVQSSSFIKAMTSTILLSSRSNSTGGSGVGVACREPCNMRHCADVPAESCLGKVVKDNCGCCPVCEVDLSTGISFGDSSSSPMVNQPNQGKLFLKQINVIYEGQVVHYCSLNNSSCLLLHRSASHHKNTHNIIIMTVAIYG